MKEGDREPTGEQQAGYLAASRTLGLSLVCILPLLVLYHFGIIRSGNPVRNMAQVWMEGPLRLVGLQAAHVLNIAAALALAGALLRSDVREHFSLITVVVMVAEGTLYGAFLFRFGATFTTIVVDRTARLFLAFQLPGLGPFWSSAPLLLALGAGVYEEVFFRLFVLGGGAWLLARVFQWGKPCAVVAMLLVSSAFFAAVHHMGPLGEEFDPTVFIFRTVCGLLLGTVYLTRGLGVAVWTHAIYNVLVL